MPALANQRHERFAFLVFTGEPIGRSYIAAGYNPKTQKSADANGSGLLARPEVSARVEELRAAHAALNAPKVVATKEWVMESLVAVAKRCMQAEPVLDSDGNPTGEYKFQHQGANRALELVGKEMGMFVDRKDVTVRQVSELSDDELAREIAAIEAQMREGAGKVH